MLIGAESQGGKVCQEERRGFGFEITTGSMVESIDSSASNRNKLRTRFSFQSIIALKQTGVEDDEISL